MNSTAKFRAFVSLISSGALFRFVISSIAVVLVICSQWANTDSVFSFGNEWLRDRFIRMQASGEPETRVVVVDIDEASLKSIGPWPWPRHRIADLVENLIGTYGARGVALDLVMPERADADGDTRLAALAQHAPVVLAQAFDYTDRDRQLRVGDVTGGQLARNQDHAAAATGFIANHAGLAKARYTGNIGFIPSADGVIRHLPMVTHFEGNRYVTLSLALMQCCRQAAGTGMANPEAPTYAQTETGAWRIPYSRHWSAYQGISAAQILDMSASRDMIQDRLVVVGSSSLGLSDRVATPLAPSTSGMLVHAAALTTLLDHQAAGEPIKLPGRWIATGFMIAVAFLAAFTLPRFSAAANVALLGGASVIWLCIAYLLIRHDAEFSASGPLAGNVYLLAVAVPYHWQIAQRKSRSLLGTLRQYVATAVVDELLRSDLKDPLTPRLLNVTTLIADMEGYTTYVESLSVEEAAQLTSDFLACLTRPVLAKHGTIDKYTGDGLVAFWGAPLPVEDHADMALEAARNIVEEVRRFSEARKDSGLPRLRVRIGIESGMAMAGDFGTPSRSIYTAVGDSVNVAARLEQVARNQPHDIIIGQGTVSRATRHRFQLLGDFVLRGKGKPTTLFTLESQGAAEKMETAA
jgi:adenylate cyclase